MKVKLRDLVEAGGAITPDGNAVFSSSAGSLGRFGELPLTVADSYQFDRIAEQIDVHLTGYAKKRNDLIKKHGTHDEKADTFTLSTQEQIDAFNVEHSELIDLDVIISGPPFKLARLEGQRISRNDLRRLKWLIDDGYAKEEELEASALADVLGLGEKAEAAA